MYPVQGVNATCRNRREGSRGAIPQPLSSKGYGISRSPSLKHQGTTLVVRYMARYLLFGSSSFLLIVGPLGSFIHRMKVMSEARKRWWIRIEPARHNDSHRYCLRCNDPHPQRRPGWREEPPSIAWLPMVPSAGHLPASPSMPDHRRSSQRSCPSDRQAITAERMPHWSPCCSGSMTGLPTTCSRASYRPQGSVAVPVADRGKVPPSSGSRRSRSGLGRMGKCA